MSGHWLSIDLSECGGGIYRRMQGAERLSKTEDKKTETREADDATLVINPPADSKPVERYPLLDPYAYASIFQNPGTGEHLYLIDELKLQAPEAKVYARIIDILESELRAPTEAEESHVYFVKEARRIAHKYRISLTKLPEASWDKIIYYVERDLAGYGPLDPLMRDPNIEDISCDGVAKPVYIWHKRYENIKTNLTFKTEEEVDDLIIKLVHKSGKHISTAFPVVDVTLPGKHRFSACFRREVTPFGSSFTIRKFRADPYTITDFIKMKTLDVNLAAYLWLCMEHRLSVMVIGGTAAGKTTLLNVLASLIRPGSKLITIEETVELNLPQENWMALSTRVSYGLGSEKMGEVSLFDLVKASLRHRPDMIVVGEVRGEEAYVLFQALATGHGGMCTMHAEELDAAIKRLTSPPMNVAPAYIPLMNLAVTVRKVKFYSPEFPAGKIARRVCHCYEIVDYGKYLPVLTWDPRKDEYTNCFDQSFMLHKISEESGWTMEKILAELDKRRTVIEWMVRKGIRDFREVSKIIAEYYGKPGAVYERATKESEART